MASECSHDNHEAFVEVYQITADDKPHKVIGFSAELRINCADCREAFEFIGLPCGMSPSKPTADVPATTARLPIKPASAPEDFGRGIPGFHIRFTGGSEQG